MRVPLRSGLGVLLVVALGCNNNNTNVTNVVLTQLPPPDSLYSISLNQAVELYWTDNSYTSAPSSFQWYRIYSTSYSLSTALCGTSWSVEGTTVAPEFLVGALQNGVPRCYGVSAVATDGGESGRSPLRQDTPRPDARNIVLFVLGTTTPDSSGFRFWDDVNNDGVAQPSELGLIGNGTSTFYDFAIHRNNADSSLWIVPLYSGTTALDYGAVDDLTSIDFAPASGYTRDSLQAFPEEGYVFKIVEGTLVHYAAVRVTHVGRQYLILDWSVQTNAGNPELQLRGGTLTAKATGSSVSAPH